MSEFNIFANVRRSFLDRIHIYEEQQFELIAEKIYISMTFLENESFDFVSVSRTRQKSLYTVYHTIYYYPDIAKFFNSNTPVKLWRIQFPLVIWRKNTYNICFKLLNPLLMFCYKFLQCILSYLRSNWLIHDRKFLP